MTQANNGQAPGTPPVAPQPLPLNALHPHTSFVVLECTGDPGQGFDRLMNFLRSRQGRTRRPAEATVVANGHPDTPLPTLTDLGVDQVDGFIRRIDAPPSWADETSGLIDAGHCLTLALRRHSLIAVHTETTIRNRLQVWLDRHPRPDLRRLPPEVFEVGLLKGEAKGLFLRGTHARRTTRPDSKNINGIKLQDALTPLEDGSFALSSARAVLLDDPNRTALIGTVGTTPLSSLVWLKPTKDFVEFASTAVDMLDLFEELLSDDLPATRAFPQLAQHTVDLAGVHGPYDVVPLAPEAIVGTPDLNDEKWAAAVLLQRAHLEVLPTTDPACFKLDVGLNGSCSGTLKCRLTPTDEGFGLSFGYTNDITDHRAVETVFRALEGHPDLLTVYYESGHTYIDGRIWHRETQVARFPKWRFASFTGYDIAREKPDGRTPQDIHDAIGENGDKSLFAWVATEYNSGWLTCDDGPEEIADFLHVADDGTLSAIHVKAAHTATVHRGIAVGAYEVVVSQAAKNLVFTDVKRLKERLHESPVAKPATWTDGRRSEDRTDFIAMLEARRERDELRVVIVQPHISEEAYARFADPNRAVDRNTLRLQRLEMLLNAARGSVVTMGADLDVIGSGG